ncbi:MAG TPA: carboxypeptidase-like regulatory domain-containing protein, partial [Chitinophagaceae bacterium]
MNKNPNSLIKAMRILHLTGMFVLLLVFNVSAKGFGQEKVNLDLKKAKIAKALSAIENQTNYRFLYNEDLDGLKIKTDIRASNASVKDVLDKLFENTHLSYRFMENNLIVVRDAELKNINLAQIITGTVTGDAGIPLSGVSIVVKGTTRGTTTDINGKFTLDVDNTNVTLVISYVGYETQEVALGGRTVLTVSLLPSQSELNAVVVIGYGTAAKRDLTGSIVKIAGKEVADKPNTNPVASLQGKVAGLSVVNSGTPGQAPDVRIRGTVSIGQVHPLYVVDGILNDNIDYINPNDIESIEVLKDP